MKKLFKILLCAIMAFTAVGFTGCKTKDNGVDATKTQMYVSYYNAGFSNRWLDAAIKRFEAAYADYSFEEGKKGVQVIPDPLNNSAMVDEIATKRAWVYFSEGYSALEFTTAGVMEDITAALTTPLNESYGADVNGTPLPALAGETGSVYDKMSAEEKAYFAPDGKDGKIYAVPYIDAWNGSLSYDADAFEEYGLYYKSDNTLGGRKATGNLGLGPDGIANTADDGLPRTYDEFFNVCNVMKTRYDMPAPFIWAGNWVAYVTEFAASLWASNNGTARLNEMLNGSGTLKDYVQSVSDNGEYTVSDRAFSSSTAGEVYSTASVYNAIDFIYRIINGQYMKAPDVFTSSYSQYVAQGDFIFGKEKNATASDYGFLVDGSWWYNEAEPYVKSYEDRTHNSRADRNLLYMPLPKATEDDWNALKGENVVYTTYNTAVVVKKGLEPMQKLLAETFVRFFCTNESLVEFNTIVSTPRGLTYTMSDEQYNTLSPYGKCTYDIHAGSQNHGNYSTYKVLNGRKAGNAYKARSLFSSTISGISYNNLANAFYNNATINSVKYFKGVQDAHPVQNV